MADEATTGPAVIVAATPSDTEWLLEQRAKSVGAYQAPDSSPIARARIFDRNELLALNDADLREAIKVGRIE